MKKLIIFIIGSIITFLALNTIFAFNTYPIPIAIVSLLTGVLCSIINESISSDNSEITILRLKIHTNIQFIGIFLFSFLLIYKLYPEYIAQCIAWSLIASLLSLSLVQVANRYIKNPLLQSIIGTVIILIALKVIILSVSGINALDLSAEGAEFQKNIWHLYMRMPIICALWFGAIDIITFIKKQIKNRNK